ncbi:hypothetical protein BGZ60DRAFT_531577 [Tricladium varicosporioides]|nr:hypothetical protein BGZ60DRAFT_531577 [Hymenoscyphus varicosporioides]
MNSPEPCPIGLDYLPPELLSSICGTLSRTDLKSLRLVSLKFSACSNLHLFHTINVRLHIISLERFCAIADDIHLVRFVREIWCDWRFVRDIGDQPSRKDWLEEIAGSGISASDPPFLSQFGESDLDKYHLQYSDYIIGQRKGLDAIKSPALEKILSKLPYVTSIRFCSWKNPEYKAKTDDQSFSRPCRPLNSLTAIGQQLLMEPRNFFLDDDISPREQVFWILMRSAIKSGHVSQLQRIYGTHFHVRKWNLEGLNVENSYKAFRDLRELYLDFSLDKLNPVLQEDVQVLANALGQAAELRSLTLLFNIYSARSRRRLLPLDFLVTHNQRWEYLTSLSLRRVCSDASDMEHFLAKHSQSLRSLILKRITFKATILMNANGQGEVVSGSFINFFQFLNQAMHLTHVWFEGRFDNEHNEIWVAKRRLEDQCDTIQNKIHLFVTHRGPFPFKHLRDASEEEISAHDGTLPWIYAEDSSWQRVQE